MNKLIIIALTIAGAAIAFLAWQTVSLQSKLNTYISQNDQWKITAAQAVNLNTTNNQQIGEWILKHQ